jgi:hypothetical protein
LQVALDQGDLLRHAKARVGSGKWKAWREENCPKVKERTDALHRRLAAHRARIEQELAANPDLGVREAVELISTPKSPKSKPNNKAIGNTTNTIAIAATTAATTEIVAKPPTSAINIVCAPTYPMSDANRVAVIDLALSALNVSRRPVSSPNVEAIQELLKQIITTVKVVTQPPQPPSLDTTLFAKAVGLGVAA